MRVSFSAGIAHAVDIRFSLDELVARADRALYAAKNEGRDTVRVADAGMTTGTHSARRVSRD
jgi:PleD family two-component response regulator